MQDIQGELEKRNAVLVAISPELPDNSLSDEDKKNIPFEVLTDTDNKVARQFGIVFELDETLRKIYRGFHIDLEKAHGVPKWELPIPAVYVIGKDGAILFVHLDTDYTVRMEPVEILRTLDRLE